MLVPVKWMKEYVTLDASDREIADRVTNTGSHVESIEGDLKNLEHVVVGKVLEITEDERLKTVVICKVDAGDEIVKLVTGAKNVRVGDHVILAKEGAVLPGGLKITTQNFGGVESHGMLCSYEELGYSDSVVPKLSRGGIAILERDTEVGSDIRDILDLHDSVIDFEITPNRADCLSIIGMARETAAAFDKRIELPNTDYSKTNNHITDVFEGVEIETEDCNRFVARVIEDVVIEDSPQWMQNYLMQAGMRPINNIVDITNFVMLEYGQPMHAYDLDTLEGRKIIVRKAKPGEKMTTLDEVERTLDEDMMLICDEKRALGIAGIMGGYDSEITAGTKRILLECANFSKENIRRNSKKLNLRSEASMRFEKGVPYEYAEEASKRFCALVDELGAGRVLKGSVDVGRQRAVRNGIRLRQSRTNLLLGTDLSSQQIEHYLTLLDFEVKGEGEQFFVKIPHFRSDVELECDLIEEVGRMYGFHNITPQPLRGALTQGQKSELREFVDKNREVLYALGMDEVLTYSFLSPKHFDRMHLAEDDPRRDYIEIENPLGEDFSVMRTDLIPSMLEVLSKNSAYRAKDMRFYEVAISYEKTGEKLPQENQTAIAALSGDYDFYYMKDVVEKWLFAVGIKNIRFARAEGDGVFHPGRVADIFVGDEKIGVMGEVHPLVQEEYDILHRSYLAQVNLNRALKYRTEIVTYEPVSKYPGMERDLSLVVDKDIESEKIIEVMKENGGDILKDVFLFDIYTGSQIEEGKKSYAYELVFRSDDRTLRDEEVKEAFDRILNALNEKYNVNLRA